MDWFAQQKQDDITKEPYYGTNEAISGFGYGAVETKFGMLGGAVVGAPVGYIAGTHVEKGEKAIMNGLTGAIEKTAETKTAKDIFLTPTRWVLKGTKGITNWAFETPKHILEALPFGWGAALKGNPKIQPKLAAMVTAAGFGALIGMVVASITGAKHGVDVVQAGRHQHKRAVDEILQLRAENTELTGKVEALEKAHEQSLEKLAEANPHAGKSHVEKLGREKHETAASHADKVSPKKRDDVAHDWESRMASSKDAAEMQL